MTRPLPAPPRIGARCPGPRDPLRARFGRLLPAGVGRPLVLVGLLLVGLLLALAGQALAAGIQGLHARTYRVVSDGVVRVAPAATVPAGSYADGYLLIESNGTDAAEVLGLARSGAPSTTAGQVSVVGSAVYLGLGGGDAKQVGTVHGVQDGQQGAPLRIDLAAALTNSDFSDGTTGWAINNELVWLGTLASRTQQRPVTIAGTGPYTVTGIGYSFVTDYNYSSTSHAAWGLEGDERNLATAGTYDSGVVSHAGRSTALRLQMSGGWCASPNSAFAGPQGTTYCSSFGPEAWSDTFEATAGDALSFDWAAANGSDDYEIYAFLVDTANDEHTLLTYGRGFQQPWTTASGQIPADGTYRFRFVSGSYDRTGGHLLGASLYIDNIRVVSDDVNAAVVDQLLQLVEFGYTAPAPSGATPLTRTVDLTVAAPGGLTSTGSVAITLEDLPQQLTFAEPGSAVYGTPPPPLAPTASSGLPVTLAVDGTDTVCAVSGTAGAWTLTARDVGTCQLRASQAGDGTFAAAADVTRTLTITRRPLHVDHAVAVSRVYDATTTVALTAATLRVAEVVPGDDVSLVGAATGTIDAPGVGSRPVTTTMALSGAQAGRYELQQPAVAPVTITPRPLAIGGSFTAADRVYDQSTAATIDPGGLTLIAAPELGAEADGVLGADDVVLTGVVAAFDSPDAGARDVSLTAAELGGAAAANYALDLTDAPLAQATITPRALALTGFRAADRVYDGTATATATGFDDDRLAGDELAFSYLARFPDKHVGAERTVSFTAIALDGGADAGNYTLVTTSGSTTASITPRPLVLTGFAVDDKVYDATATVTGYRFDDDRIAGDELTLVYDVAFTSPDAAPEPVVATFTDLAITGGADAANYTLATTSGSATARIEPRPLDVTGTRVYDGTTAVSAAQLTLSGLVPGEQLGLAGTATATARTATTGGDRHGLDVGGLTLVTVPDAPGQPANHTLVGGTHTLAITPLTLAVTGAEGVARAYDGTRDVAVTGARLVGVIPGDVVALSGATAGLAADRQVGTHRVTTSMSLRGTDAGSYRLTQPTVTVTITPRAVSVVGTQVATRAYDGTRTAALSGARLAGVVPGDAVRVTAAQVGTFASADAGTGIPVVTAMGLTGPDAANYAVVQPTLTGTIEPAHASLRITAGLGQLQDQVTAVRVETTPAGLAPVTVTYAGSPTPPQAPGAYPVRATLAHRNYTAELATAVLVVAAIEPPAAGDGPGSDVPDTPQLPPQLDHDPDGTPRLPQLAPNVVRSVEGGSVSLVRVAAAGSQRLAVTGSRFGLRLGASTPDGRPTELCAAGYLRLVQGGYAEVSGYGFEPGSRAEVWVFSIPRYLGAAQVDDDGRFTGRFPLAAALEVGQHTLQLNGLTSTGELRSTSLGVMVDPPEAHPVPSVTEVPSAGSGADATSGSAAAGGAQAGPVASQPAPVVPAPDTATDPHAEPQADRTNGTATGGAGTSPEAAGDGMPHGGEQPASAAAPASSEPAADQPPVVTGAWSLLILAVLLGGSFTLAVWRRRKEEPEASTRRG